MTNNIPIVYFHSVAPRKNEKWLRNYLTLELKFFHDFLKGLQYLGYKTITLEELFYYQSTGINQRFINIQFDDGYLDNWIYVYPIIQKFNLKITIFISPEFVDQRNIIRAQIGQSEKHTEIEDSGFLSWPEIREMYKSGLVDIQSHTMTHTKYFVSEKLISFHNPDSDSLYTIANLFPDKKPYYITDEGFQELIPYGYPLFEEKSSVIALKVDINPDFIKEVINILNGKHFKTYYKSLNTFQIISPLYDEYNNKNQLIIHEETEAEHRSRITDEIVRSRSILESKIGKPIQYCCWPHGENNDLVHRIALDNGYRATSVGKYKGQIERQERFDRFSFNRFRHNRILTSLKNIAKVKYHEGHSIFKGIANTYRKLK